MIWRRVPGLQRKLLLAFAVPLLFSLLVSLTSIIYMVDRLLIRQVQKKVASDLRAAREIYDARLERLRDIARFGANLHSVRLALERGDLDALRAQLQALRVRQGEDIFTVTDARGRVLVRSRNPAAAGDTVTHLGPVRRALVGEETASTEELSPDDLALEGEDLARRARIPLVSTPRSRPGSAVALRSAMALVAAAPVLDARGRLLGALYAGEVLNRDYRLVDRIRSTLFAGDDYEGRPTGTATVFLHDVRVSTNVPTEGGERAIGTRVSAVVAERVLQKKATWIDRAYVVNDWYLSAYEPITNTWGDVIGILYVGILERPYRALLWRTLGAVGTLQLVGGILILVLGATLARTLSHPLRSLAEGARRIEAGDLSHEIPQDSGDEIGELARDFNAMTASLRQRDAAIEGLTRGLEDKVRERSQELKARNEDLLKARADLVGMMEKQKQTNEELKASLERLQVTQEELVRSSKLAALGALAAGVAHEINTPLAAVHENLETLRLKKDDEAIGCEELDSIADQAVRMQKIVSSLLTFARQDDAHVEALDANALVRETLSLAAPQAREAGIAVQTEMSGEFLPTRGHAGRLKQVFANLVINAFQETPRGGQLRVTTGTTEDAAYVFATFANTGTGMPAPSREKIWNPLYTANPTGTGLGLSLSHAIIEEHGGRITSTSEAGKGTAFTVVLPRGD